MATFAALIQVAPEVLLDTLPSLTLIQSLGNSTLFLNFGQLFVFAMSNFLIWRAMMDQRKVWERRPKNDVFKVLSWVFQLFALVQFVVFLPAIIDALRVHQQEPSDVTKPKTSLFHSNFRHAAMAIVVSRLSSAAQLAVLAFRPEYSSPRHVLLGKALSTVFNTVLWTVSAFTNSKLQNTFVTLASAMEIVVPLLPTLVSNVPPFANKLPHWMANWATATFELDESDRVNTETITKRASHGIAKFAGIIGYSFIGLMYQSQTRSSFNLNTAALAMAIVQLLLFLSLALEADNAFVQSHASIRSWAHAAAFTALHFLLIVAFAVYGMSMSLLIIVANYKDGTKTELAASSSGKALSIIKISTTERKSFEVITDKMAFTFTASFATALFCLTLQRFLHHERISKLRKTVTAATRITIAIVVGALPAMMTVNKFSPLILLSIPTFLLMALWTMEEYLGISRGYAFWPAFSIWTIFPDHSAYQTVGIDLGTGFMDSQPLGGSDSGSDNEANNISEPVTGANHDGAITERRRRYQDNSSADAGNQPLEVPLRPETLPQSSNSELDSES